MCKCCSKQRSWPSKNCRDDPPHSPDGASAHRYRSLGPRESVPERFSCRFRRPAVVTSTQTDHASPSVATGRINAMHAMWPKVSSKRRHTQADDTQFAFDESLLCVRHNSFVPAARRAVAARCARVCSGEDEQTSPRQQ